MNLQLKSVLKVAGIILMLILVFGIIFYFTNANRPAEHSSFNKNGLQLEVSYSRPQAGNYKIFGEQIPYHKIWRTGAGKTTIFSTKTNLLVDGSLLKKGSYSLWTIPAEHSWKVIFNKKIPSWGIDFWREASYHPEEDALVIEVSTSKMEEIQKEFSIYFDEKNALSFLNFAWQHTLISLPIKKDALTNSAPFPSTNN